MSLLAKLFGRRNSETFDRLDPAALKALLKSAAPPVIVDVRGAGEFSGPMGHIDTAVNIPLDQLPLHTAALVAEPRTVVLVCLTDRRSSAAAQHLRRAGKTNVAVLRGGMSAWRT